MSTELPYYTQIAFICQGGFWCSQQPSKPVKSENILALVEESILFLKEMIRGLVSSVTPILHHSILVKIRVHPCPSVVKTHPPYGLRSSHRSGNACPAQDEIENVVRVRQCIRVAAKHQRLSRLPRL